MPHRAVPAVAASVLASWVLAMAWPSLAAAAPAPASRLDEPVAGTQAKVSCLSTRLCVLVGYNNRGVGDVVELHNGVPGRFFTVRHTQGMYSVSCPGASGCVALAHSVSDTEAIFVKVSRAGAVISSRKVRVPPGVTLTQIACTKLTSCVVAGTDIFRSVPPIEVGTWNGSGLSLHRVLPPKGTKNTTVEGLACSGSTCYVVGYYQKLSGSGGLVLTVRRGRPVRLRADPGDSMYGVSCASARLCYAAGLNSSGGLVMTLTNGVASSPQSVTGDIFAIACAGTSCTAAGQQLGGSPYEGELVTMSAGSVTSDSPVTASSGFYGVAMKGSSFAAVGTPASGSGSEVTTG